MKLMENLPIPGRYGDCKKYKVKVLSLELDKGIENFHLFIHLLLLLTTIGQGIKKWVNSRDKERIIQKQFVISLSYCLVQITFILFFLQV